MAKEKTKENIYNKLTEKFDDKAYGSDSSRGFSLSTIDAYYIIERLNEVFGLCGKGWRLEVQEWLRTDKEVVCFARLYYNLKNGEEPPYVECEGGKRIIHENLTDAYKSARTNAICKGASFLGVGLEVYKGEFEGTETTKEESPKDTKPTPQKKARRISDPTYTVTPAQEVLLEKLSESHLLNDDERSSFFYPAIKTKSEASKKIEWWTGKKEKQADGSWKKAEDGEFDKRKQQEERGYYRFNKEGI